MKLNHLTFTRFLAAIAIVIFHYNLKSWPFTHIKLYHIFRNANICVSFFFVLSGFVMIIAYGRNKEKVIETSKYYLNRVARIFPVYIFALLLSSLNRGFLVNIKAFVLDVFLIQAWFPNYVLKVNSPGWSLSVELLFYFLFPLMFNYWYRKANLKIIAIVIVGFWIVSQIVSNYLYQSSFYQGPLSTSNRFLYYFPLLHVNEFLVGNLVGFVYLTYRYHDRNLDIPVILTMGLVLFALTFSSSLIIQNGMGCVLFAPLVLLLSMNTGYITKLFSHRFFIFLGEISYSIYILQFPILSYSNSLFKRLHIVDVNLLFYGYLVILILLSSACFHFIEVPARNYIKKLK
jgi:peptidoglycan/LPS O-acetylase OafA/YrhL